MAKTTRQRPLCSVDGCEKPSKAHVLCQNHYSLLRRNGAPERLYRPTVEERFWSKVDKTDGCWFWTGSSTRGGYGRFGLGGAAGRPHPAHRVAYELSVGPIPAGLTIDHLCRTPACVRPSHLEPVTIQENLARSFGIPAINARKTHCTSGHEYTVANTYTYRGSRQCRTCRASRS